MDWVGNRAHGVNLPYKYLSKKEWRSLYEQCALVVDGQISELSLYGQPLSMVFDRELHFLARLRPVVI
jgi:hypothetical protein